MRSFRTCARIRSLTTGTFNQIFKDRIALRLSGAHSVQPKVAIELALDGTNEASVLTRTFQLSSKPYKHTARRKTLSTHPPHRISTRFPQWEFLFVGKAGSKFSSTQQYGLPPIRDPEMAPISWAVKAHGRMLFQARESGRQKIEKRTYVWRSLL